MNLMLFWNDRQHTRSPHSRRPNQNRIDDFSHGGDRHGEPMTIDVSPMTAVDVSTQSLLLCSVRRHGRIRSGPNGLGGTEQPEVDK